eukprot:CAMPEP_0181210330 /NCGR_PEP_ID=MMETSP1096-20121128/23166_1 /TAXON_ID=156174 ORGANISM="Chrysochromulina ericina, Strain CCMP281" /NCGR_SAMPLE_ID=MMETSP1096 /ASSEMBLY_ACC=CAM_ASM_000453 /LENGTH=73 /DNA_ID=CAMNT_0023301599 /DNA_START=374 /DNA_END=595 /DNA_ORIENTATION=-
MSSKPSCLAAAASSSAASLSEGVLTNEGMGAQAGSIAQLTRERTREGSRCSATAGDELISHNQTRRSASTRKS